ASYNDVVLDMIKELEESADKALAKGVTKENIWVDPGIRFVKSREEDITVMRNLKALVDTGYRILLATSRKRMDKKLIGYETDADESDAATLARTILGSEAGVNAVRGHNVKMNRQGGDVLMKLKGHL